MKNNKIIISITILAIVIAGGVYVLMQKKELLVTPLNEGVSNSVADSSDSPISGKQDPQDTVNSNSNPILDKQASQGTVNTGDKSRINLLDKEVSYNTVDWFDKSVIITISPCDSIYYCIGSGGTFNRTKDGVDYWDGVTDGLTYSEGLDILGSDGHKHSYSIIAQFNDKNNGGLDDRILIKDALSIIKGETDKKLSEVGHCALTKVTSVGTRLSRVPDSGSSIQYSNGAYQDLFHDVSAINKSKVGDNVVLCMVSTTGRVCGDNGVGDTIVTYSGTNVRTGGQWKELNTPCEGL